MALAPKQISLQCPVEKDGTLVSTVALRRPVVADMITLGDHFQVLASLGDGFAPGSAAFKAMAVIVGELTGLGDASMKLDFADVSNLIKESMAGLGELAASETAESGATSAPSQRVN
jgi:hypothetical protein